MGFLSFLDFGNSAVKEALRNGAIIIDVRNVNEYDQGRVPESINIPVNRISSSIERIKGMNRPIVFCCSTGSRSRNAVNIMKANGMKAVYNGGSWMHVIKLLKKI